MDERYFRLLVEKAFYTQHNIHYAFRINHLDIYLDGKIRTEGIDDQGNFEINGEFKNGHVYFDKHYYGKHIVYYVGKFYRNKLDLFYYFDPSEYYLSKENVDSGNLNAEIVFKNNFLAFPEYENKLIYLNQENQIFKEEINGILLTKNKIYEISLKILKTQFCFDEFELSSNQKNCLLRIIDYEGQYENFKNLIVNFDENMVYRIDDNLVCS